MSFQWLGQLTVQYCMKFMLKKYAPKNYKIYQTLDGKIVSNSSPQIFEDIP